MLRAKQKPTNATVTSCGQNEKKQRGCIMAIIKIVSLCVVIFVLVITLAMTNRNDAHIRQFRQAAVATDVPKCSDMGSKILHDGGSAIDATITSMLCVGLLSGQSSGIGGGFVMLVYDRKAREMNFIDARYSAPASTTSDMFVNNLRASIYGAKAIATPGEVKGMWEAHQKYGKLSWKKLFEPVIDLARKGFRLTNHGAMSLGLIIRNAGKGPHMKAWKDLYFKDNGTRHKEAGDTIIRSKYADTLQRIADNGWKELYNGTTSDMIIEDMEIYNGTLTKADLNNYSVKWSDVLTTSFMGYSVYSPGLPSAGPIYQLIMNVMKGFDIDLSSNAAKVRTYHRFLETNKFASSFKRYLGDVNSSDVRKLLKKLASQEFANKIQDTIKVDAVTYTNESYYGDIDVGAPDKLGSTSHVSVLAENGDAVSVTTTVNYYFGCKIMSSTSGIIYNNGMTGFRIPNTKDKSSLRANYAAPNKRPFTCISGSILLDESGDVRFVVGSSGGKKIVTTNAWVTLVALGTNASLMEAIEYRRVHNNLYPNEGIYEAGFPEAVLSGLVDLGQVMTQSPDHSFSVVQAILKDQHGIDAYSDSRKKGKAAGY